MPSNHRALLLMLVYSKTQMSLLLKLLTPPSWSAVSLVSCPGPSHKKREGLVRERDWYILFAHVWDYSRFLWDTCISVVLLCWLTTYTSLLPELFVLPGPNHSAREASNGYPTKTWDCFTHDQTVYTRPSLFSWEGPGYIQQYCQLLGWAAIYMYVLYVARNYVHI